MYVNRKAYANSNNLDTTLFSYYPYLIMANLFAKHLRTRVAKKYDTMKKLTSKLQGTAANIAFINKVIHNKVIPKFAEVKGQFLNNNEKHDSEMKILRSHLLENKRNLRSLTSKLRKCKDDLIISFGKFSTSILEHNIIKINNTEKTINHLKERTRS